ncbi:MAG: tetratricopeptide repeat protein [Bacteroidetes bacterium]|nr:tetratricopeptide repeat protein [Bacteroidota bacterium]
MKAIVSGILICLTTFVNAQNNQVVNMFNYTKSKEYDRAKAAADLAYVHETTKGSAKMWMYRGKVYQAIYESKKETDNKLDDLGQEKAVESYINCLKLDKENIYKDEVKGLLVQTSAALDYKAKYYTGLKEFEKAIVCYDLLDQALPYDFDGGLKRNNITKENLIFSRFKMYALSGNKDKTKEFGDKLIEMKYKDPTIYTDMIKISLLQEKDTVKALSYVDKGKLLFEDNAELIDQEIKIYLKQNKTDVLKKKLLDAIAVSPDNEVLHATLANVYEKTNELENAEKEYVKALEIKPDYEAANYNLGAVYFNAGNEWNKKLNELPLSETKKVKEYEAKANDYFKKAAVNFEKSYEVAPDAATKQRLRKLYLKLGETEKAEKYK